MTNGQWRGVIEEYRDLLDLPEGLPAVTLREGGTPLVHSEWTSAVPPSRRVTASRSWGISSSSRYSSMMPSH